MILSWGQNFLCPLGLSYREDDNPTIDRFSQPYCNSVVIRRLNINWLNNLWWCFVSIPALNHNCCRSKIVFNNPRTSEAVSSIHCLQ